MNINGADLINTIHTDINVDHNVGSELTDHRLDYSILGSIDPDTNYLSFTKQLDCQYYTENEFNKIPNLANNFSLFNVNIRSMPKNFDTMRHFLYELNHSFTILSITESWLKQYNRHTYNLKGYNHVSKIREDRAGGGVSLFIKENIKFDLKEDIVVNLPGVDSIAIEIQKEILCSTTDVVILSIYRPPNINPKVFIEKLTDLLQHLHSLKKDVFVLGDFNINMQEAMFTSDRIVNDFHNMFLSHYFYPMINKPTRVHGNRSSIIDNIYTNISNVPVSGLFKTNFSDHYSIFCITHFNSLAVRAKEITKREFSNTNIQEFNKALSSHNWELLYDDDNFEQSFSYFYKKMLDVFNDKIPLKTIKLKYNNRIPFLTNGLKKSIKQKHRLLEIYNKNPTDLNKANYAKHRNRLTSLLRVNERKYHENKLEINKDDSTKCWKIIKEVIGNNAGLKDQSSTIIINGKEIKDRQRICNEFNNYFINIGPKLAKNFENSLNPMQYVKSTLDSISIPIISESEVVAAIKSLKNSSAGYDELPARILKQNINIFIKPLTHLINSSIKEVIFPDELKIAKVVPIFKAADKHCIENYRPISVLSVFSKILEKVVYNHLIEFITKSKVLNKHQFGFRKQHSTNHAVISLVEKLYSALDEGNIAVTCFLDLKKAFDTVDHSILISKLYKLGIIGPILKWFKSYLSNRQQFVQIHKTKSDIKPVVCGIPQGSILGPLLFILYINDLAEVSDTLHTILFADDTTVTIEGKNEVELINILNTELQKLNCWLKANKLTINVSKSHFMVFHRGKRKLDVNNPSLNNIALKRVNYSKFLGVIIDDDLKWTNHISYIKNKIAKGFGIILRARRFFNRKTLLNLYHSFIFPYLIYCVEIWGNAADIYLLPLIKLQKKIVRAITFSKYLAHTAELFVNLDILPFKLLVVHRIGILMFKNYLGYVPNVVHSLFTTNAFIHDYNTRNKHKLRAAYGKHCFMYNNFRFVGTQIWNYIIDHLDIKVSLPKFKKIFKAHIQSNNYNFQFR